MWVFIEKLIEMNFDKSMDLRRLMKNMPGRPKRTNIKKRDELIAQAQNEFEVSKDVGSLLKKLRRVMSRVYSHGYTHYEFLVSDDPTDVAPPSSSSTSRKRPARVPAPGRPVPRGAEEVTGRIAATGHISAVADDNVVSVVSVAMSPSTASVTPLAPRIIATPRRSRIVSPSIRAGHGIVATADDQSNSRRPITATPRRSQIQTNNYPLQSSSSFMQIGRQINFTNDEQDLMDNYEFELVEE